MDQPTQFVVVPLDAGIDVSVSEQGQGNGLVEMTNFDFAAQGDVRPRGEFERLAATGAVNVTPGVLFPTHATVPAHRRSSSLPIETDVFARAALSARVVGAQLGFVGGSKLLAMTCRDQTATGTAADNPNNFIELVAYDLSGNVVASDRIINSPAPVADVKITGMVTISGVDRFILTYVRTDTNQLCKRAVWVDQSAKTLSQFSEVAVFNNVNVNQWSTSVHAVEFDATGLTVLLFTTSNGTIQYAIVPVTSGSVSSTVDTSISNPNYTEMASCHADGTITLASGHSSGSSYLGIYHVNDQTFTFSTHSKQFSGVVLQRRVAIVPDDTTGSGNTITFVELDNGVDAVLCSASLGVLSNMGELQTVRLADAGTWVEENELLTDTGSHRVPLIGLTSSEALVTNYRSHVVARTFLDANGLPRLAAAAIVAHSDAGGMSGVKNFTMPRTRSGPLPRYTPPGGPKLLLPVMVVTRTTADRTVIAEDAVDPFERSVRITQLEVNAHQHHGIVTLGPNTYVGGSVPSSWDGESLTPIGFPLPPHSAVVADAGSTAGGLDEGTYEYWTRQSYIDRQGTVFDSPVVFLSSAMRSNLAEHTLQLTLYPGALWSNMLDADIRARFVTEAFRNAGTLESGDTTFHKAFTISHSHIQAPVTIVDVRSAGTVATGELLPDATTGAITSGPLPALQHLWSHRSRLFGVDAYDPELIRFTTEYVAPSAPLWADALSLRVTNSGGPVVGGASLADKLVAFQENQISVSSGEGPDGRGQGAFAYPESLRGVGARPGSQGAIVEMPTGVMFVHRTGIYHLGFDLSLSFPGGKLHERLATDDEPLPDIHRAVYLSSRGQVWFLASGEPFGQLGTPHILVWDVQRSRWTTFSSALGPFWDVIEVGSGVYLVDTRGRLLEAHSASRMVDRDEAGNDVAMTLTGTAQKFTADDAHQVRLRKLHLSGRNGASANLVVSVTSWNERHEAGSSQTNQYTYSLPSQDTNFKVHARAVSPRANIIQCAVTIDQTTSGTDLMRLSKLSYEVSVLPGTGKTPVSKRPTTT